MVQWKGGQKEGGVLGPSLVLSEGAQSKPQSQVPSLQVLEVVTEDAPHVSVLFMGRKPKPAICKHYSPLEP